MKISVIIPTRDHEEYIEECIESILAQERGPFNVEILVGIDGSDQKATLNRITKYKSLKVVNAMDPIGSCNMRNLCADIAHGEYLALMDSDDIMLPGRLLNQYSAMNENIDVIYSNCIVRESSGEERTLITPKSSEQYIPGGTFFMRRDCLRKALFCEKWKYAFDYEYYLRTKNKFNYYYLDKKVIIYRRHGGNHLSGSVGAVQSHRELRELYSII